MIQEGSNVKKEQTVGNSRLDFKVGYTYIEVKTPLIQLQTIIASDIQQKKGGYFESYERFMKHIHELSGSLKEHERAILLSCFMYDNPGFEPLKQSAHGDFIQHHIKEVMKNGVELIFLSM